MSEAACRSGDAKLKTEADATAIFLVRPRRARVTGLWNARWSGTLTAPFNSNPKDFAFKDEQIAFESLSVAATGDACAAALKTFGVIDARTA